MRKKKRNVRLRSLIADESKADDAEVSPRPKKVRVLKRLRVDMCEDEWTKPLEPMALNARRIGRRIVGRKARVFFPNSVDGVESKDGMFYDCIIEHFEKSTRFIRILYRTGEYECVNVDDLVNKQHIYMYA